MAKESSGFSKGDLNNALGVRDATRDIAKAMKAMGTDVSNFSRDFSTVTREANNFATYQANAVKSTKNVNKLLEKANNLRGIANKQESEAAAIALKRSKVEKSINELKFDKNNKAKKLTTLQKNELKNLQSQSQTLKEQATAISNQADNATTLADQFTSLGQSSQDLSRNIYGGLASMSKFLGISDNLTNGFEEANEIQRQKKIIIQEELILQESLEKALKDYNQEMEKTADMKEFLADEEGLTPDRIRRFDLTDATGGASGTAGSTAIGKTQDGMTNTKSGLGSNLAPILRGIGSMLKVFAKSMIVLKGVGKLVEFIEYAFLGAEGEAVDLARSMNMGREAGFQMREDMLKMTDSMSILGSKNLPDLVKFQLEYTKHTGTAARLNADQLETSMLLTKQMGFSNDEAIGLVENFKASGMGAREGLDALRGSYIQLKDSNKTAMSFNQLMKDITGDTELQYIFQTKGADAAMRNAVAVRRTGLSLSQQRSMAEGTLDFEKTMTDQLELQMLTGKNINMNKAQELALQGKNGAAAAEMQKQLGQLTAEQRQNPLIMNKMLEIMGMSREEYMKQKINQAEQNAAKKNELNILKVLEKETKTFTNLKATQFKNEKDYYAKLDIDTAKLAKKDLEKYKKSKQYQLDLHKDEIQGLSDVEKKEYLLNEQIVKFSDKQIHDAKVRANLVNGELSSYEGLLTANETFAIAMEEVKVLFADLVGSGAIQFFTETLSDFAMRAKQVGIWGAIRGKGKSQKEIDEQNTNVGSLGNQYIQEYKDSKVRKDGTARRGDNPIKLVNKLLNKQALNEDNVLKLVELYGSKEALLEKLGGRKQFITSQKGVSGGKFNPREFLKDEEKFNAYSEADKAKKEAAAKALAEKNPEGDFILRPGQAPISFNKGDLIMGGTQLGQGGGKVESLLEQLLEETRSGKIIKMDTATVGRSLQLNKSKMNY